MGYLVEQAIERMKAMLVRDTPPAPRPYRLGSGSVQRILAASIRYPLGLRPDGPVPHDRWRPEAPRGRRSV